MKRLLILTVFYLASQTAYGQACGIYRIEYVGNILSAKKEIVEVLLPTTMFLHGIEKERSDRAFISTAPVNSQFRVEIGSHLTTPYNNIDQLLSFFKERSERFKMKVSCLEGSSLKETTIEINWNNIEVSIIEDGKFGTLFRFRLKDIFL
jgi:hypothetical protein